jgi:hypothetical protein
MLNRVKVGSIILIFESKVNPFIIMKEKTVIIIIHIC